MYSINVVCQEKPTIAILEGTAEQIDDWLTLVSEHAEVNLGWRYHGPGKALVCYDRKEHERDAETVIGQHVRLAMETYKTDFKGTGVWFH